MTEMVILVDELDQQVGVAEKMYAHENGLLHRAFSVFVVRENYPSWDILLQQRQFDKYHCGELWTNTCCSHPRQDETVVAAAERRLFEEMGLMLKLDKLNSFIYKAEFANGLIENEYDHVLIGFYDNQEFSVNPREVQNHAWIGIDALQASIDEHPEIYTPWLLPALGVVRKYLENRQE